jgi:hypothetical protein
MHVQHAGGAGALVQIVDVLGDDQQLAIERPVQPGQCRVGRVGRGRQHPGAAQVVEALDQRGIAGEGLWRGDILDPVLLPQSILGAERPEAALGADAGAGQDHDVAKRAHRPHEARERWGRQWRASASSAGKGAWARP